MAIALAVLLGAGTPATLLPVSAASAEEVGPVTKLPIPRFVSIKTSQTNVRRGPSTTHRIDWVFRHQGMPVIVTGEYGHWRRIVDREHIAMPRELLAQELADRSLKR